MSKELSNEYKLSMESVSNFLMTILPDGLNVRANFKEDFYFIFFELYAFIILTCTLVLGMNYFVVIIA